jgi:hypothetical protein
MKNQPMQKQWWAPVWKGLVMDPEAKHYRKMKSAVWLYLYLLINANRRTGRLMRKIATVSRDMGIPRDMVLRWLDILRSGGYIETVNTGRSLTIQVSRWKPISGVGKTQLQKSETSNVRYGKYPTLRQRPARAIPLGIDGVSGAAVTSNETNMKKIIINDLNASAGQNPAEPGFTRIGLKIQREQLAQELAMELHDPAGIGLYRSYAAEFPEWLLRKVLAEVMVMPPERITKSRGALFNYLVQHYAKGNTDHPGG